MIDTPSYGKVRALLRPPHSCPSNGPSFLPKLHAAAVRKEVTPQMLDKAVCGDGLATSMFKRMGGIQFDALVAVLPFVLECVFSLPAQVAGRELDETVRWQHITQAWAFERGGFREAHTNNRMLLPQEGSISAWIMVPYFHHDGNGADEAAPGSPIQTPAATISQAPDESCEIQEQVIVVTPLTAFSLVSSLLFGYEAVVEEPSQCPFSLKSFFVYQKESQYHKLICLTNYVISNAHSLLRDLPRAPIILEYRTLKRGWDAQALDGVECVLQDVKFIDPKAAFVPPSKVQEVQGAWVVDFADRLPGGFTLSWGTAQEELLVIQHPDALLLPLFCPIMGDLDAVRIRNVLPTVEYDGYEDSFRVKHLWEVKPKLSIDILVIDAVDYNEHRGRLHSPMQLALREINKLTAGLGETPGRLISTGNWGCGHFGGDVVQKFLLQWLVASIYDCPIVYFSFNLEVQETLMKVRRMVDEYQLSAREVWRYMRAALELRPKKAFATAFEEILISTEETGRRLACTSGLKQAFDHVVGEKQASSAKN